MTILFDLDGTLLHTTPDLVIAINQICQEFQRPAITEQQLINVISDGSAAILKLALNIDMQDTTYDIQQIGQRFAKLYMATGFAGTKPFAGILDILDRLEQQGTTWGIITNKNTALTIPLLTKLNLHQRCACIVCGDTTEHKKPHPQPLLHACSLLNTRPATCLFIGDSKNDIDAGKAAGMSTIAALYGYVPDDATPELWHSDYVAYNIKELELRIEQWLTQAQ